MSDRRTVPASERVVWDRFAGAVPEGLERVSGESLQVTAPVVPLLDRPGDAGGRRERELVLGQTFRRLEAVRGWGFGFAERDGYVGWVEDRHLDAVAEAPTHVVAARQTYLLPEPVLKTGEAPISLSFGARLHVSGSDATKRWAAVVLPGGPVRYVPAAHLRPVDSPEPDPVSVAERFLGTPYLWGGNSGWGIDCSGLVQAALLACGIPCPGDSDLQEPVFVEPGREGPYARGELLFWTGHVAMAMDENRLIHANAHRMAVSIEPIADALDRIAAAGDAFLGRGRPRSG